MVPARARWRGSGRLYATQVIGLAVGLALAAVSVALGALSAGLLAQNGRVLERIEQLEQGHGVARRAWS